MGPRSLELGSSKHNFEETVQLIVSSSRSFFSIDVRPPLVLRRMDCRPERCRVVWIFRVRRLFRAAFLTVFREAAVAHKPARYTTMRKPTQFCLSNDTTANSFFPGNSRYSCRH